MLYFRNTKQTSKNVVDTTFQGFIHSTWSSNQCKGDTSFAHDTCLMDFTSSSAFSSLFSLLSVILFLHHFPCCFKKYRQASLSQTFCKSILLWDFNISYVMINLFWWACYEIGQHCHLFFRKLFFLLFGSFY